MHNGGNFFLLFPCEYESVHLRMTFIYYFWRENRWLQGNKSYSTYIYKWVDRKSNEIQDGRRQNSGDNWSQITTSRRLIITGKVEIKRNVRYIGIVEDGGARKKYKTGSQGFIHTQF